ncbi:MAG: SUF system NifU family Fe-S cluster assembly protein [Candidatus Pacebacteria bacterium]|nr:SUF system NifU family Fe-S cluster assembly protein [Candidatus Paceibacterota bacterium]
MSDLYQEIILDHAQHPRNFGVLDNPTHTIRELNASCGDNIEFSFHIKDNIIQDIAWKGAGCAISTASSSIISDLIKGRTVQYAKSLTQHEVFREIGVSSILPTREKCLMLPLRVLRSLP